MTKSSQAVDCREQAWNVRSPRLQSYFIRIARTWSALARALPLQLKLQSSAADTAAQQWFEGAAISRTCGEEIQPAVLEAELLSQRFKAGRTARRQQ